MFGGLGTILILGLMTLYTVWAILRKIRRRNYSGAILEVVIISAIFLLSGGGATGFLVSVVTSFIFSITYAIMPGAYRII